MSSETLNYVKWTGLFPDRMCKKASSVDACECCADVPTSFVHCNLFAGNNVWSGITDTPKKNMINFGEM